MRGIRYLAIVASLLVAFGLATRFYGVQFRPPHVLLPVPTALNDAKRHQLEQALAAAEPNDRERVLQFALEFTARSLYLGFDHRANFVFSSDAARPGNCVEYGYLFVAVFNAAARNAGLAARAHRVRSLNARIFGLKVPAPTFADHDWALVEDSSDGLRLYIDPTFYDAFLGSSIKRNVTAADRILVPPASNRD